MLIGKNKMPAANVDNAIVAIRNDPAVVGMLAFDEFSASVKMVNPIGRPLEVFAEPRDVTDEDYTEIQAWLQRAGLIRIGRDAVVNACNVVARDATYHPVRDWLESLTWDGQKRCNVWLTTMLGAAWSEYVSIVGQMFLVSMVARVMEPGCKVDHMLVFEGAQRSGKSSACRALSEPWFCDTLPDISSNPKDASLQLRGTWLQEIPEMHSFGKAEATLLKSFLSRQVERYRPPWGRATVAEPRQCCFVGTTNKYLYLKDETGNGRFWPVRTGRINIPKLRDERDQLFAEALELYREDAWWWPDEALEQLYIGAEQEARYEGDAWEEAVDNYCADKLKVTTAEIATRAIGMALERVTPQVAQRIGAIMRKRGWEAKNNRGRYWERPGSSTVPTLPTVQSPS